MIFLLLIVCLTNLHFYQVFSEVHENEACQSPQDPNDFGAFIIDQIQSSVREAQCALADPKQYPDHYKCENSEQFDFIIVGAGSAGLVVANRLTEHEMGWKVLLLEAGDNPPLATHIPALYSTLQQKQGDWMYKTDPAEDNCLAMVNNSCNFPRGKMLGGSSSINGNLYVRGNKKDYDAWAAAGNTGWDYENVLKYFKKSENLKAKEVLNFVDHEKYHGKGGYLDVDTWNENGIEGLVGAFSEGMGELGYKTNYDVNGDFQTGFAKLQGTISDGKRCSTANGFLRPIKHRSNLKVTKNSLVTKILIDNSTKTAYGVEFINEDQKEIRVIAKREVIVSAGAINSPHLLMLSGIGPKQHLEDLGIEVVHDLPVGKNLQDHMMFTGLAYSHNYTDPVRPLFHEMYDFLMTNTSTLSTVGILGYGSFINTLNRSSDYPDIQIHHYSFVPDDTMKVNGVNMDFGFRNEIGKQLQDINSGRYVTYMMATLLSPESRGEILLQSKDPKQHPKIICGYFKNNEKDLDTYIRTIDFVSQLAQTEGMKKIDTKLHIITPPACKRYEVSSREFKVCLIKHMTTTTYHPTSTCRMGPDNDSNSVVNPNLQVKGMKQLRVVDASVMHKIIAGNTNAPTIMIAEKSSDLIINHALQHYSYRFY